MDNKFDFDKLIAQAKTIDEGVEGIKNKFINCDIGNGDSTDALNSLDSELSEIEGKLDFLCHDLAQEVDDIVERNSDIKKFIADLDSKIEKLEASAREHNKSPQAYLETPLSGRGYVPRYKK